VLVNKDYQNVGLSCDREVVNSTPGRVTGCDYYLDCLWTDKPAILVYKHHQGQLSLPSFLHICKSGLPACLGEVVAGRVQL